MAEIVLSSVLTVLFEKLGSAALKKLARSKGVHSDLKKLESSLPHIQAVLLDAAQREIKESSVQVWLNDLQHLAYDIDDVLDDLTTQAMHRELSEETGASTSKVRKLIPTCCTSFSLSTRMHAQLNHITTKLQDLERQINTLGLIKRDGNPRTMNRSMETSLVDVSSIVGRGDDKETLLQKLLSDDQEFSIVPIVGMGGVGKTTLARLLYNEKQVKDHFERMAWVCVSDEFDIFKISKIIFQSVAKEDKEFKDLNLIQVDLRKELTGKRFLIVLDDVWSESHRDWELLARPFLVGKTGSKIMMTTRKLELLNRLGCDQPHRLEILSPDDALSLFAKHALGKDNFDSNPRLKQYGEGIAGKCDGLPLALITLGTSLRTKTDEEEWKELLNSEIWRSGNGDGIIPALRLSYLDLPAHLKQLFAYCSFFPKDYEFDKEELVLLWMAEGFLDQQARGNTMERFGRICFQELLSRSFFQVSDNESSYMMHDLMNDLATFVAGDFFFRLGDEMDVNNVDLGKCRHMSFIRQKYGVYKKFMVLERAKSLRTLLAVSVGEKHNWRQFYLSNKVLFDLIPQLPLLRVLHFSDYEISEIPESIGSLRHLRYLNLSRTRISHLPEQVGNLYNLQTLLLCDCRELEKLPKSFLKLKNLRHLDVSDTPRLKNMPLGIGKLERIQTPTPSKVMLEGTGGFAINGIKDVKALHGRLSIEGLDKVQNTMDAKEVNLLQKRLSELEMKWSVEFDGSRKETLEKEILDMLKPHPDNLKELEIVSYGVKEFPSWVGDASFHLLAHVTISGCKQCTTLPPLGRLPLLKELFVEEMDGVKVVDSELLGTSLEILSFADMQGWEVWSTNNGDINRAFPCLRKLRIANCPNLVEVSLETLPSLRELVIDGGGDGVLRSLVRAASSVTELEINCISGLTQLDGEIMKYLGAVELVSIGSCNEMRYLWESEAEASKILVNLRRLIVSYCNNLVRLEEREEDNCGSSLPSLTVVEIWDCGSVERYSCPNGIERLIIYNCDSITSISFPTGGLKSLTSLWIRDCKNLVSFPDHESPNLTSLTKMIIRNCPSMDDSFPRGLWPPNLSRLEIGGLKKPISEWGPQHFPTSLVNLELIGPSSNSHLFHLLPSSLKTLRIEAFEELESLSMGLQHLTSLQHLSISDCPNLRDLPEALTSLQHLFIFHCPNLRDLPETLTSFQHLNISSCPNLRDLPETLTSLQHLYISSCPNLRELPETLTSLQHLNISSCPNLRDLPETLTSLQHLTISSCPNLRDMPETLTSLQHLTISYCPNLRDLPETLTSLQHLNISYCPMITDLPKALLPSLLELKIHECPKLKEWCSRRGSYWPLISRIPCILIDMELHK